MAGERKTFVQLVIGTPIWYNDGVRKKKGNGLSAVKPTDKK
jgi:hypothetical protein